MESLDDLWVIIGTGCAWVGVGTYKSCRGGIARSGKREEGSMDQVEQLMQTLIEKNNEITDLKSQMGKKEATNGEMSPLEKSMWAMLFVLCEKHVKCEKCGSSTKPATNKHNYVLVRCTKCRHWQNVKRSKSATFNAYYKDFKKATNG